MKVATGDHLQHRIRNKACLDGHDPGEVPEENGQDQPPGCPGSLAHTAGKFCALPGPANGPNGRDHYPLRLSSEVIDCLRLEAFLTYPSLPPTVLGTPHPTPGLPGCSGLTPILAPTKLFVFFVPGVEL